MAKPKEHLADWLRDAHAMELQSATMMRKLVDRLDHYPELRGRIQRHIQETEQQAARLESCIERRGEKTSTLKDVAGKMTATVQGLSRSEEHTSELQSLMRISYAVFCLKKKTRK